MNKVCQTLHSVLNDLPRFYFPLDKDKIYKNGIYVLFEKNEKAHNKDRIIRIGTHRGDNNLYNRLKEHFINENKDRSIFRKNIGRAILNRNNDEYIHIWEIDFQERKNKELYADKIDKVKQKEIEKEVSKYIQENLSFVIIEINNKQDRLLYESKLISTVSLCNNCSASKKWLGNFSPKDKIVQSGLWLVNELYKEPFSSKELDYFINNYIKTQV